MGCEATDVAAVDDLAMERASDEVVDLACYAMFCERICSESMLDLLHLLFEAL